MRKYKNNKWYGMNNPPKPGTYGLVGVTDMGYLFEVCYDKDGIWKQSIVKNHKVYFDPIIEEGTNYNPFVRWKKVL